MLKVSLVGSCTLSQSSTLMSDQGRLKDCFLVTTVQGCTLPESALECMCSDHYRSIPGMLLVVLCLTGDFFHINMSTVVHQ